MMKPGDTIIAKRGIGTLPSKPHIEKNQKAKLIEIGIDTFTISYRFKRRNDYGDPMFHFDYFTNETLTLCLIYIDSFESFNSKTKLMNKQEASAKLKDVEAELTKLKAIINAPENKIDSIIDVDTLFKAAGLSKSEYTPYTNPDNAFKRYLNACAIIPIITKVFNEDIELDWNNSNITKYLPYFEKKSSGWVFRLFGGWRSGARGPVSHHFVSEEKGKIAIKIFNQIYIDYISYKG